MSRNGKSDHSGPSVSAEEALAFHAMGRPGKLEIIASFGVGLE